MANEVDTSWHEVEDVPYNYNAKIGDLTLIYLKTSQYNRLKQLGKLVPNALYMTPDDNDSSGGFLSREDIENTYTTATDKIPSSRLVRLLLERIIRLEQVLGLTPTVSQPVPEDMPPVNPAYYAKSDADPDMSGILESLRSKDIIKTETP